LQLIGREIADQLRPQEQSRATFREHFVNQRQRIGRINHSPL
jgi:hypothetical protein